MRTLSLIRRSTAVLAATALVSTGGVAAGLLTSPAHAATAPVVTSISPDASSNTTTIHATISGSFLPGQVNGVFLRPRFSGNAVVPISGTLTPSVQTSASTISADFNLSKQAPGPYDVGVTQYDPTNPPTSTAGYCLNCFNLTAVGTPDVTGIALGADPSSNRGDGALDITGQNFANGAQVQILNPDGSVDGAVSFTPDATTPYPSTTMLRGNFHALTGFIPGRHILRVTNTDGFTGAPADFWLPYFTTVSPQTRGANSQLQTVTVTGSGIRTGSRLEIENKAGSSCSDILVGTATVSPDNTSISAPVSLTPTPSGCVASSATTGRYVKIVGPDGGTFFRTNAFTATPAPVVNKPDNQIVLGQGGTRTVTLFGSGFVGGTQFGFVDPKVTAVTTGISSGGTVATVAITAAPDAALGNHNITATNPDAGTSTLGPSPGGPGSPAVAPVSITPAPVITFLSPASAGVGTSKTVSMQGTNFGDSSGNGLVVNFRPGIGVSNLVVNKGTSPNPDTATFTVSVAGGTATGLSNVTVANPDYGASTCFGCFGVDSLSISPAAAANTVNPQISFTAAGLTAASDPHLTKVGGTADQPDIHQKPGTAFVTSGNTIGTTFDLTDAAPGKYNAVATATVNGQQVQVSCSSCFTITGQPATLTGIRRSTEAATVTKTSAGAGAVDVPLVITGTHFSRGEQFVLQTTAVGTGTVTTSTATIHDVVFVSPTQLTALLTVPTDAAAGAQDVVLTNADDQNPSTLGGGITVNLGPKPTAATPAAAGQGATGKTLTITGPDFDAHPTLDLGPGITVTNVAVTQGTPGPAPGSDPDDTLVATLTIDEAAATGARTITVTNPDSGKGSLAGHFTVNPGPKVLSISPAVLKPGDVADVTITGTGFADDTAGNPTAPHPTITIANVDATVTAFSATSMTVHMVAQSPCTSAATPVCALGARAVTVLNKGDGGRTVKTNGFTLAVPPAAPTSVAVAAVRDHGATITWAFPTPSAAATSGADGGSPIVGFQVDDNDGSTNNTASVGPTARTADLTGLVNGHTYTFTVKAINAAGVSPAGTAQGTPNLPATKLTSGRSPLSSVAGSPVVFSGRLTRVSDGLGIAGVAVHIGLRPDVGSARLLGVTTDAAGSWSYRWTPVYNETVSATFLGNSVYRAVSAPTYRMGVATKITRTAPATGSSSSHLTVVNVTGTTSPNKSGRTIYLRRGTSNVASAVVASNGTFVLKSKLPAGTYTLTIYIPATTGNIAASSGSFVLRRT